MDTAFFENHLRAVGTLKERRDGGVWQEEKFALLSDFRRVVGGSEEALKRFYLMSRSALPIIRAWNESEALPVSSLKTEKIVFDVEGDEDFSDSVSLEDKIALLKRQIEALSLRCVVTGKERELLIYHADRSRHFRQTEITARISSPHCRFPLLLSDGSGKENIKKYAYYADMSQKCAESDVEVDLSSVGRVILGASAVSHFFHELLHIDEEPLLAKGMRIELLRDRDDFGQEYEIERVGKVPRLTYFSMGGEEGERFRDLRLRIAQTQVMPYDLYLDCAQRYEVSDNAIRAHFAVVRQGDIYCVPYAMTFDLLRMWENCAGAISETFSNNHIVCGKYYHKIESRDTCFHMTYPHKIAL